MILQKFIKIFLLYIYIFAMQTIHYKVKDGVGYKNWDNSESKGNKFRKENLITKSAKRLNV